MWCRIKVLLDETKEKLMFVFMKEEGKGVCFSLRFRERLKDFINNSNDDDACSTWNTMRMTVLRFNVNVKFNYKSNSGFLQR
jgi:hypothetical protein